MTQRYTIHYFLTALTGIVLVIPLSIGCRLQTAPRNATTTPPPAVDPVVQQRNALLEALRSSTTDEERKEAMGRLAGTSIDITSAFSTFRSYLTASDKTTRGYAESALKHAVLSDQETITQTYIDDLASGDTKRLSAAMRELATAADSVWYYRHSHFRQLSSQPALRKQLLAAIRQQGLGSADDAVRSSAIQALIRIGEEVNGTRMHGGIHEDAEPDAQPVAEALVQAHHTAHSHEVSWHSFPNQTAKINQLTNTLSSPAAVF